MKTIDVLREIVDKKCAKVLYFDAPNLPAVESLEVIASIWEEMEGYVGITKPDYEKDRLLVDMQTANAMVMVYDVLSIDTKAKADRLMSTKSGFFKVADVAWKSVR